jgi:hypothetical protein
MKGLVHLLAFGNSGRSAVFYSGAEARAAIYTGLPDEPKLAAGFDTQQWPPDVVSLAVSEDGGMVAGTTGSGEIYVLASQGTPARRLLTDGAGAWSLSFWGPGERLVLLDASGSRLLTLDNPMQGTAARELIRVDPPFSPEQTRLTVMQDQSLLAVDAPAGRLMHFDSWEPGELTGQFRLTQMDPLSQTTIVPGRGSLWLLRDDGSPGRIVTAGRESIGLYYVPAVPLAPVRSSAHEGAADRRQR